MSAPPLEEETAPAQLLPAYPTLKESWGFLGWNVLAMVVVGVPIVGVAHLAFRVGSVGRLVAVVAGGPAVLLAVIWWLRRRAGPMRWPAPRLWLRPEPWKLYWLLPVLVLAHSTLLTSLHLLHLPNSNAKLFGEMANYPWLVLVVGCVAAPVCEEFLFRGILLKGLLRNYRPAVAIGQSALLFGITHFNPAQSVAAFFSGLLLGWLYYRTRSLGLCMGLHALVNLLAFNAMHLKKLNGGAALPGFTSWPAYVVLLLLAAVVLGGCVWWVQRSTSVIPFPAQGPEYDPAAATAI